MSFLRLTIFILSTTLINGCTVSVGLGVHDTAIDSEFTEDRYVGWVQGDLFFNDYISIYGRHESMPRIKERYTNTPGYGANTIGVSGRVDLR